MTLRSYWIAGSLILGCAAPKEAEPVEAAQVRSDKGPVKKVIRLDSALLDTGSEPAVGSDLPGGTEETTGTETGGTETAGSSPVNPPPTTKRKKKRKTAPKGSKGSRCRPGYAKFEGDCLSSKQADYLAEKRDEEHLAELAAADGELEKSQVQQQILEDQAEQMGKYEDDLDEILEKLEEKKKKGEGPFGKKGGDPFDG
jgi:hypothetical protein